MFCDWCGAKGCHWEGHPEAVAQVAAYARGTLRPSGDNLDTVVQVSESVGDE